MRANAGRLPQFWEMIVDEIKPRRDGITSCWQWIGPYSLYGMFSTVPAAVAAAAIYTREPPSKVMHLCDNPLCIRKDHLHICLLKDRATRYSRLTGKPLAVPITCDARTIKLVLDCREIDHSNPNYRKVKRKFSVLRKMCAVSGCNEATVKKILLKAPIYDLIDEIEAIGANYQCTPHKKVGELSQVDSDRYKISANASLILSNRS